MKNKIAFILHPLNVSEFRHNSYLYSPFSGIINFLMRRVSNSRIKRIYSSLPSHKVMNIKSFKSPSGAEVDVLAVMCPLFPAEALRNPQKAIGKVISAVRNAIAAQSNVIVLAGFSSIATDQGNKIKRYLKENDRIAITSGNTFTAALALQGVKKSMQFFGKDIKESSIAVIGASGDIGSICSQVLSKKAKKIILYSRSMSYEDEFVKKMRNNNSAEIIIAHNVKEAVKLSEVILIATSSFVPLIDQSDVNPFSIIADVSLPYNVSNKIFEDRKDVFVFDAGKAGLPTNGAQNSKKWNRFTAENKFIHGCLAEGILLGLENRIENFSMGQRNIKESKLEEILNIAACHGFDVADFAFHGKIYNNSQMAIYKENFAKRELV